MFVMNNLKEYTNMYGLNFYLGNKFHNFETDQPESGYLLTTDISLSKIVNNYGEKYIFKTLTATEYAISELRQNMVLCSFTRNNE